MDRPVRHLNDHAVAQEKSTEKYLPRKTCQNKVNFQRRSQVFLFILPYTQTTWAENVSLSLNRHEGFFIVAFIPLQFFFVIVEDVNVISVQFMEFFLRVELLQASSQWDHQ